MVKFQKRCSACFNDHDIDYHKLTEPYDEVIETSTGNIQGIVTHIGICQKTGLAVMLFESATTTAKQG